MSANAVTLQELVGALGGQLHGDPTLRIQTLSALAQAQAGAISFLSNPKYIADLEHSQATCVIVSPAFEIEAKMRGACIVTPDPYLYFAQLSQWWRRYQDVQLGRVKKQGVHPSAVVEEGALIDPTAWVGPLCVVESGAVIGANSVLHSRVHVGRDCQIGRRCVLHSGVVIGADGFGFAPHPKEEGREWEKIEQLAAVTIGDDVEIGANTTVDRGALSNTVLENGVKLDNQIQIGHNAVIGAHTLISACSGVAGSAKIGRYCTIAGGCMIGGHITICDHVTIGAVSTVIRSITQPGFYTGFYPLDKHADWEKSAVLLKQLPKLRERVMALEKRLSSV